MADRRNEPMMAVVHEQDCISCGMCFGACAFGAVTFDRMPAIHPALCSGCGACVDVCPTAAIELVPRKGSDA
jgi:electron transfer flavoprotein alpha subunit